MAKARLVPLTQEQLLAQQLKNLHERIDLQKQQQSTPTVPLYGTLPLVGVEGQVAFAQPFLMGRAMQGNAITSKGLGIIGGWLLRNDPPILAGDVISVRPPISLGGFSWMGARLHEITGASNTTYSTFDPDGSDPFGGDGFSGYTAIGSFHWNQLVALFGVSDFEGDSISWTHPASIAEQYSWDITDGHIGYSFHDFTSPNDVTDVVTGSFANGGTTTAGAVTTIRGGAGGVTIGSTVGESDGTPTDRVTVTVTSDVAAGTDLLVVLAADGMTVPVFLNPNVRPIVQIDRSGEGTVTLLPHVFHAGQWRDAATGRGR